MLRFWLDGGRYLPRVAFARTLTDNASLNRSNCVCVCSTSATEYNNYAVSLLSCWPRQHCRLQQQDSSKAEAAGEGLVLPGLNTLAR
jgi:hypothetical protein